MTIYDYLANSNTDGCLAIIYKYGYGNSDLNSKDDVAHVCKVMVASEGENALRDLIKIHPDRDLIIEDYSSNNNNNIFQSKMDGCKCAGSCGCNKNNNYTTNSNTNMQQGSSNIVNQTNTFILIGAALVAIAIITAK
jgi:hypothetical protein